MLLCSDGLFNEVSGDEIAIAVEEARDPAAIVDALIEGANAQGGRDNISVLVIEVAAEGAPAVPPSRRSGTPT